MNYSMEKINTVAGCDLLLAPAQHKKELLVRKRRNLGESIDNFRKRLDQLDKESLEVQTVRIAYTTAYHALPEGSKYKASMNVDVKRLELRKARLEKKAFTCNVRALLSKQLLYNKLDAQVQAIEGYIATLVRRKAALGQAMLRIRIADKAPAWRPAMLHPKSQFEKRWCMLMSVKATHPVINTIKLVQTRRRISSATNKPKASSFATSDSSDAAQPISQHTLPPPW